MALQLSDGQINAMQVTERVASIFSLLGILFILSTFLLGRGFDKPINRLIFFASWSNLGMNIATLIGQDGITAGGRSDLCQFQAWAVQMFLGVDVFWALCMALNVYLALFQGWTAKRMRVQEWKYFVGCYGASFIPAFVYLFVKSDGRGKVYGPALLWCWISPKWDFLRVATLYGIVWIAIFAAFAIYCFAFRKVWRNRHELKGIFNPFIEDPFAGIITTEIAITRESRPIEPMDGFDFDAEAGTKNVRTLGGKDPLKNNFDPYSVNVEVGEQERRPSTRPEPFNVVRTWTRNAALQETNPEAWLYARVAFLFFCALLISWVPASINRLYSFVHPNSLIYALNYIETLVLPLQGFWNSLVYIITSQTACRNLCRSFLGKPDLPRKHSTYSSGSHSSTESTALTMPTPVAKTRTADDEWDAKAGSRDHEGSSAFRAATTEVGIGMKNLGRKVSHAATTTTNAAVTVAAAAASSTTHHGHHRTSSDSPHEGTAGSGIVSQSVGGGGEKGSKGGKFERFMSRSQSVRLKDEEDDDDGNHNGHGRDRGDENGSFEVLTPSTPIQFQKKPQILQQHREEQWPHQEDAARAVDGDNSGGGSGRIYNRSDDFDDNNDDEEHLYHQAQRQMHGQKHSQAQERRQRYQRQQERKNHRSHRR